MREGREESSTSLYPTVGPPGEHQRAEFCLPGKAGSELTCEDPWPRIPQPSPCQTCGLMMSNVRGETAAERTLLEQTAGDKRLCNWNARKNKLHPFL